MTQHAPLAPSAAHQWLICPGSVAMQRRYPEDEESESAREGTAAHYAATESDPADIAPNGVPIDQAMREGAALFRGDIEATLASASDGTAETLRYESPVEIFPDCYGTPDAYAVDHRERIVHIWDYKYGHAYHDPVQHPQLMLYAWGVLRTLPGDDWTVSLTIVQPRNYHPSGPVRSWETTRAAVAAWVRFTAQPAGEAAMAPDAPLVAGIEDEHCDHCSAQLHCPAYWAMTAQAKRISRRQSAWEPGLDTMGLELREVSAAADRLKAMKTGLEEQALGAIRKGQHVPGWTTRRSEGLLVWNKQYEDITALGDAMGVQVRKPVSPWLVTPTQAIKLGIDETVITSYSTRNSGALKLIPDDGSEAARVFGGRPVRPHMEPNE